MTSGSLLEIQRSRFQPGAQAFIPPESLGFLAAPNYAPFFLSLPLQQSGALPFGQGIFTALPRLLEDIASWLSPEFSDELWAPSLLEQRELAMGLLPSSDTSDPREIALNSQLPLLSEDVLDWSIWNSVANVSVIKVSSKAEAESEIAFLKTGNQCLALSSTLEREIGEATATAQKPRYQIWIHDTPVGEVKSAETAYQIATKLRRLLQVESLQPSRLKPLLGNSFAAGGHDSEILFVVDQSMLLDTAANPALVASQWINNLRVAFGEAPLELVDVQMIAYGLRETNRRIQGTASWYGPYFHGRQTATGEIFNQHELTAAHPSLPFGTYLKVHNRANGRSIVVRVNDRGPYVGERSLDLSYAAAQCLGSERVGVIPYEATILKPGIPARWDSALIAGLNP
ncbi:septal ring lytic transglycosylase RlpA family protein [Pseudanabaena sp. FACHB-2040]|uniref:septal ring lytic transglycosylase RlpA family protein n=1 Tax=Pseudanabaena sp. FACHB-2040 TaxID=2692859 RepID=UPI001F54BC76|nr:septal ring lytic transglycosylase RlpA family protein [Pseudanabaena sp. FACHB-2040]